MLLDAEDQYSQRSHHRGIMVCVEQQVYLLYQANIEAYNLVLDRQKDDICSFQDPYHSLYALGIPRSRYARRYDAYQGYQ